MRGGIALLVLLVCACESRYGTYLTVDGDAQGIGFDSVELFFGSYTELKMLQTPTRLGTGRVFKRRFDASDRVSVDHTADGAPARETTFYLPDDETNLKLGEYVLAIAFKDEQPVGIGEVVDFKVDGGTVYTFDIELEPYSALEVDRWGDEPGCVAWTKPRDGDPLLTRSTYAVVTGNDYDCDGLETALDCDDASYCTPGTECGPHQVCGVADTCALGCGDALTCTPRLCLYPTFCDAFCATATSIEDRHACGLRLLQEHMTARIAVGETQLCTPVLKFRPYDVACTDAKLELTDPVLNNPLAFSVSDDGSNCIVSITANALANLPAQTDLVISFQGPEAGPRWSFVLGVQPEPSSNCDLTPVPSIVQTGQPADCQ